MGCFQSKKDSGDIHPNVFRVVNIDESGADLWSGQLEITETDLILYREGRDATVWPLASLRRYGFDGEIFSFESGRRCSTGAGIYAFRCRRAGMLFRTLQQNIQLRNLIQDTRPFHMPPNLSNGSPNPLPRQTLQASVVHRSSIDGGQPVRQTPSSITNMPSHVQLPPVPRTPTPRSPSGLDILEMTPLYPRTQNPGAQPVANIYQVKELKSKEHNNNHHTEHAEPITDPQHSYCNDFNSDLAALRTGMEQFKALSTILDNEDVQFSAGKRVDYNVSIAKSNAPLSPTLSNASEHYAQLSIEQREAARFMTMSPKSPNESDPNRSEGLPSTPLTPLTPRIPEYCNFGPTSQFEMNSYANLSAGEMVGTVNNLRQMLSSSASGDHPHKFSESDTFPSMSPVEELEVNYAVLELDPGKEARGGARPDSRASSQHEGSSQGSARPRHLSQSSLEKAPGPAPPASVGYTTIDFDKTVALTSVADDADFDEDGCRKTRHSSTACSSPSSATDKNKN